MSVYEYGVSYGPHNPPMPLSDRDMRALDHASRHIAAFDVYRCGAHHLTLTVPDFDLPKCEMCEGESLAPVLIVKWRGRVRARAHDVVKAWRRIGKCEDEFGAASPACGEYRDVLDARIIELESVLTEVAQLNQDAADDAKTIRALRDALIRLTDACANPQHPDVIHAEKVLRTMGHGPDAPPLGLTDTGLGVST